MKKIIFILLFSPFFAMAQHFDQVALLLADSSSKSNIILADVSGFISSNSLRKDIYSKFIWGGNISQSLKETSSSRLESSNIGGVNAEGSILFVSDLTGIFRKGYHFMISYNQHLFSDAKVCKAIPDMILNGNNQYLGKPISLNNTSFNMLNYATLSMGILKTIDLKSEIHNFGFSLGYAAGFSNIALNMTSGQIKFAEDGSNIDLNAIYQLSISDTSGRNTLNGNGWVSSFYYQYIKPNAYSISCSIEDLGQIKWGNTALSEQKNIKLHFEGFQISDLINVSGDEITHTKDSLVNSIYYPSKILSYSTPTPCRIGLNGRIYLSSTILLTASVWKYANTNQQAGMMLKPILINLIPTLDFAPYVIRNGYSPIDIGLEVSVKTIKNTLIKVNLFSVPVNTHTLGGGIMVGYKF